MPAKGQKLSEQSVTLMKDNKRKRLLNQYKWDLVKPYLDINLSLSSRGRKRHFITLRQFKEYIESGLSIREIQKLTSKNLVSFYSILCQGKIDLSKNEFIQQYESGKPLEEIAEDNKISKDYIGYLRQLYRIKSKGAKFIRRKETETPLTQRQIEILYGSMLGDAQRLGGAGVLFRQGGEQKDYLLWKYKEFESVASPDSLKSTHSIDFRSETEITSWSFYTFANTDIEKCISSFYQVDPNDSSKKVKEVSRDILNQLTPLSLSVWFMDDGQTDFQHRSIVKGNNSNPTCNICTDSFSKKSCENIKEWFKEKFDIDVNIKDHPLKYRMGYRIRMNAKNTKQFIDLISPHILPMFQYKTDYESYKNKRLELQKQEIDYGKIMKCPLGVDFKMLTAKEQSGYIENLVVSFYKGGFNALMDDPKTIQNHMNAVLKVNPNNLIKDDFISFSNVGNRFLMAHFPNYWDAKAKGNKSPREIFENKKYLSEIIRKIITNGTFPNKKEILKSLKRYRGNKAASGFMPCVAKSIYHKYCDKNSKVIDFCAGYGGRLFGAFACEKVFSYTGIEINFKTYYGLHDLYKTLREKSGESKEMSLLNQDSIIGMKQFKDNTFDFCFTSPPYFDAEEYEDSQLQSSQKYDTYGEWFEEYLIKCVQEATRISRKVAIDIANTGGYQIADDLERWLNKNNYNFSQDQIRMPRYDGKFRFEPIFVIE
jgi:16S rRNA G966 N2-methylase RsmD